MDDAKVGARSAGKHFCDVLILRQNSQAAVYGPTPRSRPGPRSTAQKKVADFGLNGSLVLDRGGGAEII